MVLGMGGFLTKEAVRSEMIWIGICLKANVSLRVMTFAHSLRLHQNVRTVHHAIYYPTISNLTA